MDSANIYAVPLDYHAQGLDTEVLDVFGLKDTAPEPDLTRWEEISHRLSHPDGEVTIAIVGKYTALTDAYKSLIEALVHGGVANNVRVKFDWIEGEVFEKEEALIAERLTNAGMSVIRFHHQAEWREILQAQLSNSVTDERAFGYLATGLSAELLVHIDGVDHVVRRRFLERRQLVGSLEGAGHVDQLAKRRADGELVVRDEAGFPLHRIEQSVGQPGLQRGDALVLVDATGGAVADRHEADAHRLEGGGGLTRRRHGRALRRIPGRRRCGS